MIKINKGYLFVLFAMYSNLNAMQPLYVTIYNRAIINIVSGAFLDRLQENEGIASKRSIADMKDLGMIEAHQEKIEGLTSITAADWLYWQTIKTILLRSCMKKKNLLYLESRRKVNFSRLDNILSKKKQHDNINEKR